MQISTRGCSWRNLSSTPRQPKSGDTLVQIAPMDVVASIKQKQPQAELYTYPDAPHGFYCDERASYRKEAGDLAWKRTVEFLGKHMKK